jgi:hypothetical protein
MHPPSTPRIALKRGALLTAANWQVVVVQFVADAVFKTLVAVPIVGGIVLVVLLVGVEPTELLARSPRESIPALASVLLAQPLALAAFLTAVALVLGGGSVLMFLVKGGTVSVLVAAEREAGPLEQPPLRFAAIGRAGRFAPERFTTGARTLFPRYLRLGLCLLLAYAIVGAASFAAALGPVPVADPRWTYVAAAISLLDVVLVTLVNLLYLLTQIVIAADDCDVWPAVHRVARLLVAAPGPLAAVFGIVLTLVALGTAASILATAALGLIAFVPFLGLAALPLQLAAWLLRGLVFQFLGLAALAAYLRVHRLVRGEVALVPDASLTARVIGHSA